MKEKRETNPKKATLLVVDDKPDNLRVLVKILKEHSFQVRPALGGQLALDSALASPPDLILLDILMPAPNGYEVCRTLKQDKRTQQIPVIFISGLEESTDKVMAFDVGGVDFISKPFSPPEVIARINTHLNIMRLTSELAANNKKLLSEIDQKDKAIARACQLQREMEKINKKLEKRVVKEVEKRQAQQQILIQRSKLESLGELAAGMAHEINQPLSGISMALDNIICKAVSDNKPIDPDYLQGKFETLQNHVERIRTIIDHVRVFSREQNCGNIQTVDAKTVCENAISMIQNQYKHHGFSIQFTPPEERYIVKGNMYKLEQVILNLLSNARDALDGRRHSNDRPEDFLSLEKKIELSLDGDPSRVRIRVADNGIGIGKHDLEKIFNPFFTTKSPERGTGLGLSVSHGIIKEFKGTIDVETKPGKGTVMIIVLPRVIEKEGESV